MKKNIFILLSALTAFFPCHSQSIVSSTTYYCTGQVITFTYTSSCASGTLTWSYGGGVFPSGATVSGASLSVTYSSPGSATVSASCSSGGNATTPTFTVQQGNTPVSVTLTANQNNICSGTAVTFTASSATGGINANFGFMRNNASIGGGYGTAGGTATLTTTVLGNGDQIYATMTPDYTKCPASLLPVNSSPLTMVVNQRIPAISISAAAANASCQGSPMTFTASVNGTTLSPNYQWQADGQNTGANSSQLTTTALGAGTRVLTCTLTPGNNCYVAAASNTLNVSVVGPPPIPAVTTFIGTGTAAITPPKLSYPWTTQWADNPVPTAGENIQRKDTYLFNAEGPNPVKYTSYYHTVSQCETTPRTPVAITVYFTADPGHVTGNTSPVLGGVYKFAASHTISGYSYQWTVSPAHTLLSGQGTSAITLQIGSITGTDQISVQASNAWKAGNTTTFTLLVAYVSYVRDETILVPGIYNATAITPLPVTSKSTGTTYIDGLGRNLQHVAWQQSPGKADMVQPAAYDQHNRQPVSYLPYTANSGDGTYKITWATDQPQFYQGANPVIATSAIPTALTVFEPTPMDRVWEQGAAGADWQPADLTGHSTGNTVKMTYQGNSSADGVRIWNYDYTTGLCASPGTYQGGTSGVLYSTQTTDEHGFQSWTYTDKTGKTIYKRTQDNASTSTSYIETYNVYDDFGQLRIVIPPMAVSALSGAGWVMTQTILDTWCFQYLYDEKQRMSAKKIPGAGWVSIVYDQRDRPVLTQDANQQVSNQYTYTKYDQLNRPVVTGLCTLTGSLSAIKSAVYAQTTYYETRTATGIGYTLGQSYPVNPDPTQALTVTFYDDYSFKGQSHWPNPGAAYDYVAELNNPATPFTRLIHKVTGVKVKVLNDNTWLKTVSYYDDRYRVIQSISDNYTASGAGGLDRSTSQYDFAGRLLSTQLTHTGIENVSVNEYYYYDHAGRLLDLYHSVNGASQVHLASYSYNELGQLVEKGLQSPILPCMGSTVTITSFNSNCNTYLETQQVAMLPGFSFVATPGNTFQATIGSFGGANPNPLQSVDYRYNIRGWLTSINNSALSSDAGVTNNDYNDLWGMEFRYNTTTLGIGKPQFNGNIAEIAWNRRDYTNNLTIQNPWGTAYSYDPLNRLKTVKSARKTTAWALDTKYDESFSYDKNGNITALTRNGVVSNTVIPIDQLTNIAYNGNQLTKAEDAISGNYGFVNGANTAIEYTYDANGNQVTDLNKNLTVAYNYLNLPQNVLINGNTINYTYDAGGRVLKKTSTVGISWYCGGVQFEQDGTGAEQLYYVSTGAGRVVKKAGVWGTYEYFMTDHLGNIAMSFDQGTNGNAEIIQGNTFYAFGLGLLDGSMSYQKGDKNRRLFNKGSELQDDFGLNVYATRYRTLALDIPHWLQIDPKADQGNLVDWSTYHFSLGNPLRHNDPDGDCPPGEDCLGGSSEGDIEGMANSVVVDILSVKHSAYNLLLRAVGSTKRATFVQNEEGNYQTGFVESYTNPGEEILQTGLDMLSVATFGKGGGATGGLLGKTPGAPALTNAAKAFLNKNANAARSTFAVYQISIDKVLNKIGKADATRVTKSSGQPTRLHQQIRKLREANKGKDVDGKIIKTMENTTTAEAKEAETQTLHELFMQTGEVPPGNQKSYKPQ